MHNQAYNAATTFSELSLYLHHAVPVISVAVSLLTQLLPTRQHMFSQTSQVCFIVAYNPLQTSIQPSSK